MKILFYRWPDGTSAELFTGEFSEWNVSVTEAFRVELRFSISGPPKLSIKGSSADAGVFARQVVGFRLGRKVLGLAVDLGVEHAFTQGSGLFSTGWTPSTTMPYPRWVDEDRWGRRYEEAARRTSSVRWVNKKPPLDQRAGNLEPFLGVYPRFVLGLESGVAPPRWLATYDGHVPVEGWSLEDVVDAFTSQELLLPASARGAWEAANTERGEFLLPSPDEVEVFRIFGEPLPFFWGKKRFEAWLSERGAS